MLTAEEAQAVLLASLPPPAVTEVRLADADGRILARDVVAGEHLPAFDRAAMDGYAVRAADVAAAAPARPVALRLAGESAAGVWPDRPVAAGEAVPIATGAPLPPGADAVVPLEHARRSPDGVALLRPVLPGQNVSRAGEDVRAGETVLRAGTRLDPAAVGVLAALGRTRVPVIRRPRVAVIPTGDELVDPAETPSPGQVRNSTAYALAAAVRQCGAEPRLQPPVPDRLDAVAGAVRRTLGGRNDVVLVTGGASVGDRDLTRAAFAAAGCTPLFWRIAIKPGMNVAAARRGRRLCLGLSGNPAAALTSFAAVVHPVLCALAGVPSPMVRLPAVLDQPVGRRPDRFRYVRVQLHVAGGAVRARPAGPQLETVLSSLCRANGLAVIPPGRDDVPPGQSVDVLVLPGWEGSLLEALATGGRQVSAVPGAPAGFRRARGYPS